MAVAKLKKNNSIIGGILIRYSMFSLKKNHSLKGPGKSLPLSDGI